MGPEAPMFYTNSTSSTMGQETPTNNTRDPDAPMFSASSSGTSTARLVLLPTVLVSLLASQLSRSGGSGCVVVGGSLWAEGNVINNSTL